MISVIYERLKYRKCRGCGITRNLELAPVCPVCLYKKRETNNRKKIIQKGLKFLSGRNQRILRFRFGLDDGKEKTLEETGGRFGITRGRVYQIERLAIQKTQERMNSSV